MQPLEVVLTILLISSDCVVVETLDEALKTNRFDVVFRVCKWCVLSIVALEVEVVSLTKSHAASHVDSDTKKTEVA